MPPWTVHFETFVRSDRPSLIQFVAQARAFASVIRGIPIPPYVEDRLHRLNILRAVRGTTSIEGTEASEQEVGEIIDAPVTQRVLPPDRARDEQEVRNAQQLMYDVARILLEEPDARLTEQLIRRFHVTITQDIDYPNNSPGRYRTGPITAGDYQTPNHDQVPGLMEAFVRWFNTGPPKAWDPLVRAVVAHFYVVSIHPFGDGNGRTSRGVEAFLLAQAGVNARGFYSLANYYYRHRPEYIDALTKVRFKTDPDLTPFVEFALDGLVQELEEVHRELLTEVQVIAFRDFARQRLERADRLGTKTGARQLMFLLRLGKDPVSLRDIRAARHPLASLYRGVTPKTLSRDVNYLKSLGLVQVSGDERRANVAVMLRYTADRAAVLDDQDLGPEGEGHGVERGGNDPQLPLFPQ